MIPRTCLQEAQCAHLHAGHGHVGRLGHHLEVADAPLARAELHPQEDQKIQVARQVRLQLQKQN